MRAVDDIAFSIEPGRTLGVVGERIEVEAPKWLKAASYAEPFALRALGVARSDETMLRQAVKRFEAMELSWHAEQTKLVLLRGGRS